MLAHGLRVTGVAGRPEEYFWEDLRPAYAKHWGLSPEVSQRRFLRAAIRAGTTPNGMFGAKVHWFELQQLLWRLRQDSGAQRRSARQLVDEALAKPSFVRLVREDKVRQALSYHKALVSGEWWRAGQSQPVKRAVGSVDFRLVWELESLLASHERLWTRFFAQHRITPLVVTYEELCVNYTEVLRRVLTFIGVGRIGSVDLGEPVLEQQADEDTELLVHDYITTQRSAVPLRTEPNGAGRVLQGASTNGHRVDGRAYSLATAS